MIRSGTPWDMGGAHPETRGRREPQQQLGGRKGRCLELPGFASLSGRGWDTRVCCSQGLRSPGPSVGFGFPLKTAVSINRRISPCSPNPFSHPIIRRVLEIPRPVTRRPEAGGLMAWVWPGFWDLYTTARAPTGRQIWDPCLRPPQTGLALGRGKGRDAVCGRLGPPGSQQGPPAGLQGPSPHSAEWRMREGAGDPGGVLAATLSGPRAAVAIRPGVSRTRPGSPDL